MGIFVEYALCAGGIRKRDILVAGVKDLENFGRVRNSCSKSQRKQRLSRQRREKNLHSLPQMDQSSWHGEIRYSEHPPSFRIILHKAKSTTKFFKESRTGLNQQTNNWMTSNSDTISGVILGVTFIVITLHQELNSVCRSKGHSQN